MTKSSVPLIFATAVLTVVPCFGQINKPVKTEAPAKGQDTEQTLHRSSKSVLGIYYEGVTPDGRGNIWVGGSIWLLQGLLLHYEGEQIVNAVIPNSIKIVKDLFFTEASTGWLIADGNFLYHTTDGGTTWKQSFKAERDLSSLAFSDQFNGWSAGAHGVIYHTSDAGITWLKQDSSTTYNLNKILFVDSVHGWAIGGIWKGSPAFQWMPVFLSTNNGGKTWKTMPVLDLPATLTFITGGHGWGIDKQNNILKTDDGGENWVIQYQPGKATRLSSIYFLNALEGWVAGDEILHTEDGGETWSVLNDHDLPTFFDKIVFTNNNRGWAFGFRVEPESFSTRDGGKTWTRVPDTWKKELIEKVYSANFRSRL